MNLPAPTLYGPGDAYVDPDYRTVALPASLAAARAALFGTDVDRYGANRTLDRLQAVIDNQPRLREISRVTDTRMGLLAVSAPPAPEVLGPSLQGSLRVPPIAFAATGRGYGIWTVTLDGTSTAVVEIPGAGSSLVAVTGSGPWLVGLPGSYATASLPVEGVWSIRLWALPTHIFTELATTADPDVLFDSTDPDDDELFTMWRDAPAAWERAAAAAIALARRIDEVRS